LEVTGLAAVDAVVEAVLAEAHVVLALAEATEAVALAAVLFLIAIEADEFLGHDLLPNVPCNLLIGWQQL
jgi:hypothetical protein